jgi:phosphoglycerate dehydrogenase-like enzyme
MKALAGRKFFRQFGEAAQAAYPEMAWSLLDSDGTWSATPEGAEIAVLIGDAYCPQFKDTVLGVPTMRWVHTENTGTDGVFYEELLSRNILLTRSPGANAPEAAEFVFAALLWSVKRLGELREQQKVRRWERLPLGSLCDRTILVAGLGAVGSRVARIARSFGMHVLGIRRSGDLLDQADEQGTLAALHTFLPRSDFVVLALPLTDDTRGVMEQPELDLMKDGALLVNVGRGELVDIEALKTCLKYRPGLRALFDVMPEEPWPVEDDLWRYPNFFLSPHVAWSSPRFRPRAAGIWLENLRCYLQGEKLKHVVEKERPAAPQPR